MMRRPSQTFSPLVFVLAVLVVPWSGALAQDPTFTDIAEAVGLDSGGSCAWSAAWTDYDSDGHLDVYITNHLQTETGSFNLLFRGNGDGTFSEVAGMSGELEPFTEDPHGGGWADSDNDGDADLFVSHGILSSVLQSNLRFYTNEADGTFLNVTDAAGVTWPNRQTTTAIQWVDHDGDGLLDAFLSGKTGAQFDFGNILFRNNGDGTFTDVADAAGVRLGDGESFSSSWQDYDGDTAVDVFVCIDGVLFGGNGDGTYTDRTAAAGISLPSACRSASWGDYDNDQDPDLYVSVLGANILYRNEGNGTFTDVTSAAGLDWMVETQGSAFGDIDNDGDLDLLVVSGENDSDANRLYRNNGDGTFAEIAAAAGVTGQVAGKGGDGMMVDVNRDGFLDLFVTNGTGSTSLCATTQFLLYENNGESGGNWLEIELIGELSNRDGLGTKIWVTTADGLTRYWQHFGPQHFVSQDRLPVHFGLGTNAEVESIDIEWPSGAMDHLTGVAVNQTITVTEGSTGGEVLEVTGVVPNEMMAGTSGQLTVSGTGFEDGAAVVICQQPGRVVIDLVQFVDSNTLLVDVTVPGTSAPGVCGVKVTNPDGEFDVLLQNFTITGGGDAPEITGVDPTQLPQGSSLQLTVTGSGFQSGIRSRICQDGRVTIGQVTFVDSTTILLDVTVPVDATLGLCGVRVRNPDTQSDVLPNAVEIVGAQPTMAPLLEYQFEDDPAGDTVANTGSLAGADGTIEGVVTSPFFTDLTPFDFGQALFFGDPILDPGTGEILFCEEGDASGRVLIPDVVDYTDPDTGAPLDKFTVESWVWWDNSGRQQAVFDDSASSGVSISLQKFAVRLTVNTDEDPGGVTIEGGFANEKEWHHIAGTYDGQELRVYVDGVDTCFFQPTSGFIQTDADAPTIGGAQILDPPRYYCGALDDFRLHPRVLDESELADGFFPPSGAECPVCGDGVVEAPEECDEPGSPTCVNGASCLENCQCPLTYDGTVWDIRILDIDTQVEVDTDVFTFENGTFRSDSSEAMGCTLTDYSERVVVIMDEPRLRFTARYDCDGALRKWEGSSPCDDGTALCIFPGEEPLDNLGGWLVGDEGRQNAIAGQPISP